MIRTTWARWRRLAAVGAVALLGLVGLAPAASAQDVEMTPTADGAPGGEMTQKLIDWLGMFALWGSLAAMVAGAAIMGISQRSGGYGGSTTGRYLAIGGAIGAIVAGLAPTVVNLLFDAAQA